MAMTTTSTTNATARPQGSAPHPGGPTGRAGGDIETVNRLLADSDLMDEAVHRLAAYIHKHAVPMNFQERNVA